MYGHVHGRLLQSAVSRSLPALSLSLCPSLPLSLNLNGILRSDRPDDKLTRALRLQQGLRGSGTKSLKVLAVRRRREGPTQPGFHKTTPQCTHLLRPVGRVIVLIFMYKVYK